MNDEQRNENEPRDIIGESLSSFKNKQSRKIKRSASNYFTGWGDGSVFSIIGRAIVFVKETIMAINEAIKIRRAQKDAENEQGGD